MAAMAAMVSRVLYLTSFVHLKIIHRNLLVGEICQLEILMKQG
jgi:hypothetical protein